MSEAEAESPEAAPPPIWGTKLSLVAVALSFVTPIVGLFFCFGKVPWVGAIIALCAPVLGIGAITLANRARRTAKRTGRPRWPAVLAIVLASLTVLPTSVLGGAVALVDGLATIVPPGSGAGYAPPEPGWGWAHSGSACGDWTCARVPSGQEMVAGTVVVGTLIGISMAMD